MITDPVADLLIRIKNAQRARHHTTRIRGSKMAGRVLEVIKNEGFIAGYEKVKDAQDKFDEYEVTLKYFASGEPVLNFAKRVSRPGRRVYKRCGDLQVIKRGLGIAVLSTSQGVVSDSEARSRKLGGEVLAEISC